MALNQAAILGRLTHDVELRTTQNGKHVVNFTIAVGRKGKDAGVDFINCVAWEKTADLIAQYCGKGSMVAVAGRIQVTQYEQDGKKRSSTDIIVDIIDFLDKKREDKPEPKAGAVEYVPPEIDGEPGDLPF